MRFAFTPTMQSETLMLVKCVLLACVGSPGLQPNIPLGWWWRPERFC